MGLLKVTVFAACVFALIPSVAQTTSSSNPQSSKASQATAAPKTLQGSQTGFIRNPFVLPSQAKAGSQPFGPVPPLRLQRRELAATGDPGIFAPSPSNFCGAIVTYHFSKSNSPQLESITTCTPMGNVTNKYVQGEHIEPPNPRMLLMK
jgi:hypothetical protein